MKTVISVGRIVLLPISFLVGCLHAMNMIFSLSSRNWLSSGLSFVLLVVTALIINILASRPFEQEVVRWK